MDPQRVNFVIHEHKTIPNPLLTPCPYSQQHHPLSEFLTVRLISPHPAPKTSKPSTTPLHASPPPPETTSSPRYEGAFWVGVCCHLQLRKRYYDIINKKMSMSDESTQNLGFSLKLLVNLSDQGRHSLKIDLELYDSLQLWLLQQCDRMQLQRTTKFLAKAYFDRAVTHLTQVNSCNAILYLLACVLLAVKFNENRSFSESLSIAQLVELTQGQFQHRQFLIAEEQILRLLNFKLRIVSPYEIAHNFTHVLRKYPHRKARLSQLQTLIDFVISLPNLILMPSEDLFLACFFMIFQGIVSEGDREMMMRGVNDGVMIDRIRGEVQIGLSAVGGMGEMKEG